LTHRSKGDIHQPPLSFSARERKATLSVIGEELEEGELGGEMDWDFGKECFLLPPAQHTGCY